MIVHIYGGRSRSRLCHTHIATKVAVIDTVTRCTPLQFVLFGPSRHHPACYILFVYNRISGSCSELLWAIHDTVIVYSLTIFTTQPFGSHHGANLLSAQLTIERLCTGWAHSLLSYLIQAVILKHFPVLHSFHRLLLQVTFSMRQRITNM